MIRCVKINEGEETMRIFLLVMVVCAFCSHLLQAQKASLKCRADLPFARIELSLEADLNVPKKETPWKLSVEGRIVTELVSKSTGQAKLSIKATDFSGQPITLLRSNFEVPIVITEKISRFNDDKSLFSQSRSLYIELRKGIGETLKDSVGIIDDYKSGKITYDQYLASRRASIDKHVTPHSLLTETYGFSGLAIGEYWNKQNGKVRKGQSNAVHFRQRYSLIRNIDFPLRCEKVEMGFSKFLDK